LIFSRTTAVILLTLCCLTARADDAVTPAAPDGFTTSYWCGPPAKFLTSERMAEVKAANFTLAFPACGAMTVQQNLQMLDYCQKIGIKAVIADSRMVLSVGGKAENQAKLDAIIKDYSHHPALYAYHVIDEPGAGAFHGLAEVIAYLKEQDPRHPGFINILPTYGRDFHVLGTKTYDEYVRSYVKIVKPAVISYDNYSMTYHGDRPDFFENLDTVRKVSLESGIPFWNIVLAVQHFDYRHLNQAELSFEAMQTLAYGAHGLLWFTYWSPADTDKSAIWQHAMINPDGSHDPHYDMIKGINANVLAIGAELMKAKSVAVIQQPQTTTQPTAEPKVPIAVTGPGQFTIGIFKSSDDKNLALVTNRDYKKPLKSQLTVHPADAKVEQFDPAKKQWAPAKMPDKHEGDVIVDIPAGGGVLLRW
jgi:hypothetical protein